MGKRIKNPIEVRVVSSNGEIITSLHYGLECDDGLDMRRGFVPLLTPAQQTVINSLVSQAMVAIAAHEGI